MTVKIREVFCHYIGSWMQIARRLTRCPRCGAELDSGTHRTRERRTA